MQLDDASQHGLWKETLQDHMFRKTRNVDMDALTTVDTLDEKFFKSEFKAEYKAASADDEDDRVDPMEDVDFIQLCTEHAFKTGQGFHSWLYDLFADIKGSLGEKIRSQTGTVKRGDLVGLLKAIKLALLHHEVYDPDDLDQLYTNCTMAEEGENDVMKYVSVLKTYRQRLETAGYPTPDRKDQ